jgi:phosphoribosylamine--glycine ligase
MRFRFISNAGAGIPVIVQLLREGHTVDMWTSKPVGKAVARGIVPQVSSWRKSLDDVDVFVFDMVGNGDIADKLKKMGKKVFGGSLFADRIELDRSFGLEFMKRCRINVPETRTFDFKRSQDAIQFLRKREGSGYTIKPHNNAAATDTYVGYSADETIRMIEHFKSMGSTGEFDLQKTIEGVEVSVEGWFDGTDFMENANMTFEDKRFLAGDCGPNTGCMGSVVYECGGMLVSETLKKTASTLKHVDYRGPIDLNLIVTNEEEIFGLEWTPRLGYNAIIALTAILNEDLGHLISDIASGQAHNRAQNLSGWGAAVRVSVPPYPNEVTEATTPRGLPILEIDHSNPQVFPVDVEITGQDWRVHGLDGVALEINGVGNSPREAVEECYEVIQNIVLPNAQYRNDVGRRASKDSRILRQMGLITAMGSVFPDETSIFDGEIRRQTPVTPGYPHDEALSPDAVKANNTLSDSTAFSDSIFN